MTAINVFLQRDRAFMMTDAALYTPAGLIIAFGQKAVAIPGLKSVIACRGAQKATALIAMELSAMYHSFDAMASQAARDLTAWHDINVMELAKLGLQDINIVVVGWSEQYNRPMGFYLDSRADAFNTFDSAESFHIGGPLTTEDEDRNLHSIGCEIGVDVTARNFDPIRHGIPYMEAQRRMRINDLSDFVQDEGLSIVGGNILLSEVSQDGISQKIIHRWNDIVGEPIQPAPFIKSDGRADDREQMPPGLSRQMRRAWKSEHRKKKAIA